MANLSLFRVRTIARRDLAVYLENPTGYVFLTLFVMATCGGAFLQDEFFIRNIADLALLNRVMPMILMLFVPAITMSSWSEERRSGTDELLLTMPVLDVEVILGKFLGAVGVFSVGLLLSEVNVLMLLFLGRPDPGLLFATYVGYWLVGLFFVAVGLLASMFTQNITVSFVLGVLGTGLLVLAGLTPWTSAVAGLVVLGLLTSLATTAIAGHGRHALGSALAGMAAGIALWLSGLWPAFSEFWGGFGVSSHFQGFGEGVIRFADVVYFFGATALVLYTATFLLGRRHW